MALPVIATRISVRQSWPGHTLAVSRQTIMPAASRSSCSPSAFKESPRAQLMKACPQPELAPVMVAAYEYSTQSRPDQPLAD